MQGRWEKPWLAVICGEGNGTPLLENPMEGGAWEAAVHGVAKSRTGLSVFTFTFPFMPWRRNWQPTPVFLPGESQGRGSLVGCRLRGRTESDRTEAAAAVIWMVHWNKCWAEGKPSTLSTPHFCFIYSLTIIFKHHFVYLTVVWVLVVTCRLSSCVLLATELWVLPLCSTGLGCLPGMWDINSMTRDQTVSLHWKLDSCFLFFFF